MELLHINDNLLTDRGCKGICHYIMKYLQVKLRQCVLCDKNQEAFIAFFLSLRIDDFQTQWGVHRWFGNAF